jgi:hypothetical protein
MKNALIYFLSLGIFIINACISDSNNKYEEEIATKSEALSDLGKTLVVPWIVELNDSSQMMEIKRNPEANLFNLGPQDMVDALNLKYPQIKLEWVKQEGKRAIIKIEDANYLTRELGTEGASAYLAELTYSITELKGIEEIELKFEEGDHACPGVYRREDFKNFN